MSERFLPAGSVVLLKDSTKKVIIMGYCQAKATDRTQVFDYCGAPFPEGYMSVDKVYLFNHEQIEEIYFVGYMDEEQKLFMEKLTKFREDLVLEK